MLRTNLDTETLETGNEDITGSHAPHSIVTEDIKLTADRERERACGQTEYLPPTIKNELTSRDPRQSCSRHRPSYLPLLSALWTEEWGESCRRFGSERQSLIGQSRMLHVSVSFVVRNSRHSSVVELSPTAARREGSGREALHACSARPLFASSVPRADVRVPPLPSFSGPALEYEWIGYKAKQRIYTH